MPQSLSALERGNPPPRRKSCAGCVDAKRRCDLGNPVCSRCTQRGLQCRYPSGVPSPSVARSRAPHRQPTHRSPSAEDATAPPQMNLPLSFSLGMVDEMATPATGGDSMFSTYGDASSLLLPILDTGRASTSSSSKVSLFDDPMLDINHASLATSTPSATSTTEMPGPQDNDAFWNDVLKSITAPSKELYPPAVTVNPWQPITPSTALVSACDSMQRPVCGTDLPAWPESIAAIFTSRLQYILDECSSGPTSTVLENRTPWSHPSLWATQAGMPRLMQDAQACCALHMAKNDANRDVISRNLDSRAIDLMASPLPYNASSSSTPVFTDTSTALATQNTPLQEQLAHTQALVLHLLMRMNDPAPLGDQLAEALEVSTTALLDAMRSDAISTALAPTAHTNLPLYPLAPARDAWRAWIVAESTRRTALVAFVLRQIFCLQRGRPMHCGDDVYRIFEFSCPASLWAAKDAVEFVLAWRAASGEGQGRDKRKVVNVMELKDALESGNPEDFDALGKMALTAVFGIDEVKGWYASKGAVF